MEGLNNENKEAPKRIERDSTPEEAEIMSRYIDLRTQAYQPFLSEEERSDFAQNLIDTVKQLNNNRNLETEFREEMFRQIKTLEDHYLEIRKVEKLSKQLERESRGGVLVPYLYENVVNSARDAISKGVPAGALYPFREIVNEYLDLVGGEIKNDDKKE